MSQPSLKKPIEVIEMSPSPKMDDEEGSHIKDGDLDMENGFLSANNLRSLEAGIGNTNLKPEMKEAKIRSISRKRKD